MKGKRGTVFALIVILVAGLGLYAAWRNQELPDSPIPPDSSSMSAKATRTQTPKNEAVTGKGRYEYSYAGLSPAVAAVNQKEWYLLLVNKGIALPSSYKPGLAVCLPGIYPENREMDARVAPKYRDMYYAALKEGAELIPFSGYRQISTQKRNFDDAIADYRAQGKSDEEAVQLASQSIMPPGCSEHEAGLAMDITRKGVWETRLDFEDSKEFAWLQAHAAEYGFILRYPRGKEAVTGVGYEPWHWRYVGVEAAKAMKANGKCLEEYLGR